MTVGGNHSPRLHWQEEKAATNRGKPRRNGARLRVPALLARERQTAVAHDHSAATALHMVR
jgi:hypothetical protein